MSSIRMFAPALILAISIIGCAAEPASRTDGTGSDDTARTDPSTPAPSPSPTTTDPSTTPAEPTGVTTQITHPAASTACNAGGLFCCNVVASASTPLVSAVLALLGVSVELVDESVGLTCQTAATAAACTAVATCCTSNLLNLVALDCSAPNTP